MGEAPDCARFVSAIDVPVPAPLSPVCFEEPDLTRVPPLHYLTVEFWSDMTYRKAGIGAHMEPVTRTVDYGAFHVDPYAAAHWLNYGVWPTERRQRTER